MSKPIDPSEPIGIHTMEELAKAAQGPERKIKGDAWGCGPNPKPARVGLLDGHRPPTFSRGDVVWADAWARFLIVLHYEAGFLMGYPCLQDGSTDGLHPPVLIVEHRVRATGVHREI